MHEPSIGLVVKQRAGIADDAADRRLDHEPRIV